MYSITFTIKLVTPLLMFGAFNGAHRDNHAAQPEIRAASIRGGLRYWLRAVYGAAYGSNIEGLHEAESRIFGSTSRGSAITVRVQHRLSPVDFDPIINSRHNDPKRENALKVLPERFGFAGFEQASKESEQSFLLSLVSHPLRRDMFNPAFNSALLLAFTLGGFGKRARRGGGALQIVGVNGDDAPSILRPLTAQNGAELAESLKTSIFPYVERAVVGISGTPYAATAIPAYPVFAPDQCRVFVGTKGEKGYLAALKQMWSITGAYHRVQAVDRHGNPMFRQNRHGEQEPMLDRWAWGYVRGSERRASALHMRVYECGDGKYYPIVTIFRGGRRDENWGRMQEVIDLFERHSDFERAYGNTTRW